MMRVLAVFNLLGVVTLAVLLGIQWQVNSRVNQRADHLETVRQEQVAKLEENDRTIMGQTETIEEFRGRLTLAEAQLKDLETKLNQMTVERNQIAAERDQYKIALPKWMAAVNDRDAALKKAAEQIQKLAKECNELVQQINGSREKK
jgi:HAMP domain-containing protein